MLDYKPNIVLSTNEFKVVGTKPIRHDGPDKVIGRAKYGADTQLSGMLYGKVLRSPHAHARIKNIDYSKALQLPGVKAVVTADDLPNISPKFSFIEEGSTFNYGFHSRAILAREKVLYRGHAVAAVTATNVHIAEEALSLIDVEYEVLKPVLTALDAMKDDAPILHEMLSPGSSPGPVGWGEGPAEKATNVANHFEFRLGDVDEGFREADEVVEREFHTKRVHQGYIEPQAATAMWGADGYVTIWTSTQGHFVARDHISRLLGIPVSRVKTIATEIGGGFGAKGVTGVCLEPIAAILSRKTGQPVKLAMSRIEVFATGPTSSADLRVKIGATKEGKITAAEGHLVYEAGAFPGSPVGGGARCMFASYDIPNGHIEAFDVLVNTPKTASYRAPGAPIASYAVEQVIDELCQKLSIDPIELRLLNAAREGTRQVTGPVFSRIGCVETLEATKNHPHYSAPLGGPNRGRGVALGFWGNGSGPASAIASVNPDGTVSLVEGSPDIGGSRVALAMHAAEVLGIAAEDIRPSIGDTDSIGYSTGAGGSGVTHKLGMACYVAAQDVKQQMVERAATIWDVPIDEVEYQDGVMQSKSDPELKMTFKDLAARLNATGGPISGRANLNPGGAGPVFCTNIVDVEVDPETGKVDVLRYTVVQDVGKAIHPSYVEGQMQGAAVQGIGWALNEEYYYNDEGNMVNSSFLDYRMPTSLDLPMIDTVIVEVPNPGHPFGARGVGEVSLVPCMGAIANAVQNATGVRMTSLPMSPGHVMESIWADKDNKES